MTDNFRYVGNHVTSDMPKQPVCCLPFLTGQ